MEIIKPNGKRILVPGRADLGARNHLNHCKKRKECGFWNSCLTAGFKKPGEVAHDQSAPASSRMEAGLPRHR